MRVFIIVLLIGLSAWLINDRADLKAQNAALENSVTELKKKVAELSVPRPPATVFVPGPPAPPAPAPAPPTPKVKTWMDEKLEQAGKALDQPPRSSNSSDGYRQPGPNGRPFR